MKQTRTFFLSFGLILLVLCSCDKSVQTEADATMAKARKRAMVQPSELGNFVVNPDLDAEFQVSETEIVEELISYGFLNASESVEITPIYSERIIPLFFKSLIVEPESNEWYGIDVDEVMNMYMEFPSIAFYIINTPTEKSFLTTADKRFSCNLVEYRSPDYLDPEIITVQENLINELYESGAILPTHSRWDSLLRADFRNATGMDMSDDKYKLKVCYWQFQVCPNHTTQMGGCSKVGGPQYAGPMSDFFKWSQKDVFGDCDEHNHVSGSIALSILKILCFHEHSCVLFGENFDGHSIRDDETQLRHWVWLLYNEIDNAGNGTDCSERGLNILRDCGLAISLDSDSNGFIFSCLGAGKVLIVKCKKGNWQLINCGTKQESTCIDDYIFVYDCNECESYIVSQFAPEQPYEIYSYEFL